jgi:hypothetical protein
MLLARQPAAFVRDFGTSQGGRAYSTSRVRLIYPRRQPTSALAPKASTEIGVALIMSAIDAP